MLPCKTNISMTGQTAFRLLRIIREDSFVELKKSEIIRSEDDITINFVIEADFDPQNELVGTLHLASEEEKTIERCMIEYITKLAYQAQQELHNDMWGEDFFE